MYVNAARSWGAFSRGHVENEAHMRTGCLLFCLFTPARTVGNRHTERCCVRVRTHRASQHPPLPPPLHPRRFAPPTGYVQVLDLFVALEASDSQLDFPTVYASAREGWSVPDLAAKGPA